MGWWLAPFYDRMVARTEEACFRTWRRDLLADLHGEVVELGAGTGANVDRYPITVDRVVFTEPDPGMRRQLVDRLATAQRVGSFAPADAAVLPDPAHRLSVSDGSVDAVVTTLVLCTVPDPSAALAEARRVLRPSGRLVFLEHVAADGRPDRLRWQQRLDPIWHRLVGGCRLTRRTAEAIDRAGFTVEKITPESARKALPVVRPTIRGHATSPGSGG
ncbi:class I SAM-dependent methyltransferase [soil metagenome]